jgi:diadenosine tetraphosphate (Ap4A) HIT family hydrolase
VERTDDLVVAAALSAKTAHELMLWPPRHTAQIDPAHGLLESLAGQVRRALRAFRSELGTPAFNLGLYVGPAGAPGFHWHMHLLPRPDVATMGGLEMTTGMILLAVSSDGTARLLRDALAEQLVA